MKNRNSYFRIYHKKYRMLHGDRRREIEERSKKRPTSKKSNPNYMKEWRSKNKDKIALYLIKYRIKKKASAKLNDFISRGKIKRLPCEVCGKVKSQGHHDDYAKPLEVIWLCHKHHRERHRKDNL
jgi:hypothetical protein